jgi:predicted nucleic acid-binding protein
MIIIADTSALVALSTCDALYLLKKMFVKIVVSQAIYDECKVPNKSQSEKLQNYLKDKIETTDEDRLLYLPSNLGQGEISAMLLYKKLNANYLLIDDNRARKIAKFNNINIIGSLGFLLLAKNQKHIMRITPFLDILEKSDLYISQKLIQDIKILANE